MSLAFHENVRIKVSTLLLNILRNIVRERIRTAQGDLQLNMLNVFLEKEYPETIPLLMPQEIYVGGGKYRVDAVFSNLIAFDYKSKETEFDKAIEEAKTKYIPFLKNIKYFIVTNYDSWRIYSVVREKTVDLKLIYSGGRDDAVKVLKQIISEIKVLKIPPYPELVEKLYTLNSDEFFEKTYEVFKNTRGNNRVRALFEAYVKIMKLLYGETPSSDFYEKLFVKHTLMHMMVLSSLTIALGIKGKPVDVCSGVLLTSNNRSLNIALPYLNWWKIIYDQLEEKSRKELDRVLEAIVSRASLVDWEIGSGEDVFRCLYEVLVDPETRRAIGEYYTPLWIVDLILKEFTTRDKLVMDPFCGSGTFLVRAFYKKISEGEKPDQAYRELIGFDINPLAVAVARAELIIAYRRVTESTPQASPHIYHIDTLALWYGGIQLAMEDPDYLGIVNTVSTQIASMCLVISMKLSSMKPNEILDSLSKIERTLLMSIKLHSTSKNFSKDVKEYLINNLRETELVESVFKHVVGDTVFVEKLEKLVERYGDDVWAITIISALASTILMYFKPHIIVTNPPWVLMTKYQSNYSENIRRKAIDLVASFFKINTRKASSIVTGSDVSCMALYKALDIAREGVGFVMPREQSFYSESPMRSGILLTYAVIRDKCRDKCDVKLIDINYDAFKHGVYPALVIVKKNMERK